MSVSQSLSVTETSYDASSNSSKVKIVWKSTQSGQSYRDYKTTGYYWISKNGGSETKDSVKCTLPKNSTETILSKTIIVKHKIDGSGSIKVRTEMDTHIKAGVVKKSVTKNLTKINRASTVSLSSTNVNVGDTIKATITRKSSSFTHYVYFFIGDTYDTATYRAKYTDIGTSKEFTIPESWANGISGKSATAKCTVTTKYNGSTIGSVVSKSFTINKPTSGQSGTLSPTITGFTISPGYIVTGQNNFSLSAYATPALSASISKYTFESSCFSTISGASNYVTASWNNISGSDSATFKVTVTDSNGRTATQTKTLYLSSSSTDDGDDYNDYTDPKFTAFSMYRADSSGNSSSKGEYLKFEYSLSYYKSSNIYITLYYTVNGVQYSTSGSLGNDSTGEKLIHIGSVESDISGYGYARDSMGGYCYSNESSSYGSSAIVNIKSNGNGLAIGKKCQTDSFECGWPARFVSSVSFSNTPTVDDVSLSTADHDHDGVYAYSDHTHDEYITTSGLLDFCHPVGEVFLTTNSNFNPNYEWGGSWEKLTADAYFKIVTSSAGSLGGTSSSHQIPVSSLPSHRHDMGDLWSEGKGSEDKYMFTSNRKGKTRYTEYTGGGKAYYPYYYGVYAWHRTS